jgi:hypothetical protein
MIAIIIARNIIAININWYILMLLQKLNLFFIGGYYDDISTWIVATGYYDEKYEFVQHNGFYNEKGKYILYPKPKGDLSFMI